MSFMMDEDESDAYSMHLQLEDSQTHISDLLEMLAMENFADESMQASSIINSMGSVLGKFSENRFDFQSEMNAMLESSRRGMLTHSQLSELVSAEANRSHHLVNILDSLRYQIENMHDALAELRDSTELDEDSRAEFDSSASRLAMKVNLIMKSVSSMDRIVTAAPRKLPAAIACIDSEVVMHVNKTKLEGKSPSNTNKPAAPTQKPSKHASVLPPSEKAGEGAAKPVALTGDLAALDPANVTGNAPAATAVVVAPPVETRSFGCQVNLQPRSPIGKQPINRGFADSAADPYDLGSPGATRRSLRQNTVPGGGAPQAAARDEANTASRDVHEEHGASAHHDDQHDHDDHDGSGTPDLHCPSGEEDSVGSALTADSKPLPHHKAGGKHAKDKKHAKKKPAGASSKSYSSAHGKHGGAADAHHADNHTEHPTAEHRADQAHPPSKAAPAAHHGGDRSTAPSPVPRPTDQPAKSSAARPTAGIAAVDHQAESPVVTHRSATPPEEQATEENPRSLQSLRTAPTSAHHDEPAHSQDSNQARVNISTPSASNAAITTDPTTFANASPATRAYASGTTSQPAAVFTSTYASVQNRAPAPINIASPTAANNTSSSTTAAMTREDVAGMSALRTLTDAELEEKLQSVVEYEVRKRVKIALSAAAAKDYNGFAAAIGSKSPHSRQTFAQYTGRPVSKEGYTPERINSAGDDRIGLVDAARASGAGSFPFAPGVGGSDFAAAGSGSGKKTVTIVERGSSHAFNTPHVIVPTTQSQKKPGIIQQTSMLSMDSITSASGMDPSTLPPSAAALVPLNYGVPSKVTVEHLMKDESLQLPVQDSRGQSRTSSAAAPVAVDRIINTPPPMALQPMQGYDSVVGSGSGQSMDVGIHGRTLHGESSAKHHHHSDFRISAPSESLLLGSVDHSATVQGLGKYVLEGSNITLHESGGAAPQNLTATEQEVRQRRKQEDARRRSEMADDDSVHSNDFRRFMETDAKKEKQHRAAANIITDAPLRVEIFNQIFTTTKDPKKLELIKIQLPEASQPVPVSTASSGGKAAATATLPPKTDAAEPMHQPTNPHASWIELSASDVLLPGKVPPGHVSAPAETTLHGAKVARAFKDAEISTIKNALSKALESDTYSYLMGQLEKLFAQGGQPSGSPSRATDLPVFDNQGGILLTRTYRAQTPPTTFVDQLSSSDNPLLCLHQEYSSFLSKNHRLRLLNAAVMEDRLKNDVPQSKSVQQLLALLLESVLTLVKDCNEMLSLMGTCEDRVATMAQLLRRKPDYLPVVLSSPQIVELYGYFGQIESLKLCVDLKLIEFRSIFERINAQSMHEIENLMKESTDFEYCYKHFLACQGKSVELNQRLTMCKDRCMRYNLGTNSDKKKKRPKIEFDDQTSLGMGGPEGQMQEMQDMRAEIEDLQDQLTTAREEYEDQEVEMLEMLQERDRSPDALLFFAIMHDPSYLTNLQQMVLQLKHLKSFADGTGHMDFLTLRKRIQVCVVLVPSVEKLVDRYSSMYQKWSAFRLNWFSARKLNGGSADAFNSCPLCFQCVTPDGDGDGQGSPKRGAKHLAVTGMDRTALQRQGRQIRQSASLKQLKQSRPPVGIEEMSTISSPDRDRRIQFTLPNIK